MEVPLRPPVEPMLARLERTLPAGDGVLFEPKWDGFRCVAFRGRDGDVDLRSRNQRPFARYFPEVVAALAGVGDEPFVLDGELLATRNGDPDFEALLLRLHPAASRVAELSRTTPVAYVVFDVLALGDDVLCDVPLAGRRRRLERLLDTAPPAIQLTPATTDRAEAGRWLASGNPAVDGVMVKRLDEPYRPGVRGWTKVKPMRTADCVVAGFRWYRGEPEVGSLLLGLHDGGVLRHVGIASSFSRTLRRRLVDDLAPCATTLEEHPWRHGFALEGGAVGRLAGAGGRWAPGMTVDWIPVRPELVAEVAYDRCDDLRFRHPARFVRWRPDRDAASCTVEQLACRT